MIKTLNKKVVLRIDTSYLSGRSMLLTYKGAQSTKHDLPTGSPQGPLLGGLIFMIKFSGAFLRPSIPRILPLENTPKFVDGGSMTVGVNLKSSRIPDATYRPRPLNFRERCGMILPAEKN